MTARKQKRLARQKITELLEGQCKPCKIITPIEPKKRNEYCNTNCSVGRDLLKLGEYVNQTEEEGPLKTKMEPTKENYELLKSEKKTMSKIAQIFGMSTATLYNRLKEWYPGGVKAPKQAPVKKERKTQPFLMKAIEETKAEFEKKTQKAMNEVKTKEELQTVSNTAINNAQIIPVDMTKIKLPPETVTEATADDVSKPVAPHTVTKANVPMESVQKEYTEIREQIKKLVAENDNLLQSNGKLEGQRDYWKNEYEKKADQADYLSGEIEKANDEFHWNQKEISDLKAELQQTRAQALNILNPSEVKASYEKAKEQYGDGLQALADKPKLEFEVDPSIFTAFNQEPMKINPDDKITLNYSHEYVVSLMDKHGQELEELKAAHQKNMDNIKETVENTVKENREVQKRFETLSYDYNALLKKSNVIAAALKEVL